jgi:acyl-CoA reductase-like NAD-dependent aldehyde dehydrogenase
MTGGQATFDAIVWGRDVAANKAANKRAVTKPFDAELGAVSPWIIVPGQWTDAELKHHADFLVACKMANAGAVCASPQAIIVDAAWPQLAKFSDLVTATAKAYPPQPIFYTGSCARETTIADGTVGQGAAVEWIGGRPTGDRNERNEREPVHLAVLSKVAANTPLVKTEAFAPVLGFVPIGGTNGDAKAFLKAAVAFANKECYGTLSGSLMIDPRTEAAIGSGTLDEALHELKYGAIGVNDWGGTAVFKGVGRWGAAPGAHTAQDIQSGVGYVGNARLFDHAEKTVVFAPFVTPGHFAPPNEGQIKVLQRMSWFSLQPTTFRLFGVLSAALLNL